MFFCFAVGTSSVVNEIDIDLENEMLIVISVSVFIFRFLCSWASETMRNVDMHKNIWEKKYSLCDCIHQLVIWPATTDKRMNFFSKVFMLIVYTMYEVWYQCTGRFQWSFNTIFDSFVASALIIMCKTLGVFAISLQAFEKNSRYSILQILFRISLRSVIERKMWNYQSVWSTSIVKNENENVVHTRERQKLWSFTASRDIFDVNTMIYTGAWKFTASFF